MSATELVRSLWNDRKAVQAVAPHALRRTYAALAVIDGQDRIFVREDCPPADFGFLVFHELGHHEFTRQGVLFATPDEEERACDAFAGAMAAPKPAFEAALTWLDRDLRQISVKFGITESHALLRLGEVTGRPVGLVRPGLTRTRGTGVVPLPETFEAWSRSRTPKGWKRSPRVDGDRARIGFVSAA